MIKSFLLSIIFLLSTLTSTYAFDIRDTNNAKIVSKAAYQVNNTNLIDDKNAIDLFLDITLLKKTALDKGKDIIKKH